MIHCNRAGAYQGLKLWALSLADCYRATALVPHYTKVKARNVVAAWWRLLNTYFAAAYISFTAP